MCLLIPAEISALLTTIVGLPLCGALVVVCGNGCTRICGWSAAKSGIAGAKNNATDTALINCVFIGLDAESTLIWMLEILSCHFTLLGSAILAYLNVKAFII